MEERRKHKRLDLEVMVELERLDEESVTTLKYVHVEVTDISRSGLGFKSKEILRLGAITIQGFRSGRKKLWMLLLKSSGEMLCRRAVINMDAGLLG